MKKKKNKLQMTRFEKRICIITLILLIMSPVVSVYAKSTLSKINYEVEEKKEEIKEQEKANQSLEMIINELASLDNLESVAKSEGLSYNSSSIKTVE